MALTVGELNAKLGLDSGPFSSGLTQAQGLAGRGALAIGAALAGGAAIALKSFVDFDTGVREVFTLLPQASEQTKAKLVSDVKAFAVEAGRTTSQVLPALYQALSAGVPQENVFDFLRVANQAAVGGVTDLETAVDGLSSVVNAYGSDVLPATRASDLFFTTVRLGKTTFGELSGAMFQVAPIAAATGVAFEDVSAALAAITLKGTPTSVAATQIRGAIAELSKEGQVASQAFEHAAGVSFPQFIREGGNLGQALQLMATYAAANGKSVVDMFGSIEAGQAALALTGEGAAVFTATLDQMQTSAGATQVAYQEMDAGMSRSMDRLKAKLSVLAVSVGEQLAPAASALLNVALALGPALGAVAKMLELLTSPLGMVVPLVLAASKGFSLLNNAMFSLRAGAPRVVAGVLNAEHAMGVSARTAGGLTGKLGGLLGAINPVGLAVAGAVTVFAMWSEEKRQLTAAAKTLRDSLDAETGAVTKNTTEIVRNMLAQSGLLRDLTGVGITVEDVAEAMAGNTDKVAELERKMRAGGIEGTRFTAMMKLLTGTAERNAQALEDEAAAAALSAYQAVNAANAAERVEQQERRRAAAIRNTTTATRQHADATQQAGTTITGEWEGLDEASATYVRHMAHRLDVLNARNADLAARTATAVQQVGDAFSLLPGLIREHGGDIEAAMAEVLDVARRQRQYEADLRTLTAAGLTNVVSMLESSPDREAAMEAARGFAGDLAAAASVEDEMAASTAAALQETNPANAAYAARYTAAAAAWLRLGQDQRAAYLAGMGTLPVRVPEPAGQDSEGHYIPRAGGGRVERGRVYVVGEKRPELFVPDEAGSIWPDVPPLQHFGGGSLVYAGAPAAAGAAGDDGRPLLIELRGDVTLDGLRLGELALQNGQRQVLLRTGIRSAT